MFSITIEGLEALESAFGSAANIIRDGVATAVMAGVREGAEEARRNHLFQNRTGDLEASIEGTALGWHGYRFDALIRAKMNYASFVENGTRFARPFPFMALAYFKAEAVIIREIEVAVVRAQGALDR